MMPFDGDMLGGYFRISGVKISRPNKSQCNEDDLSLKAGDGVTYIFDEYEKGGMDVQGVGGLFLLRAYPVIPFFFKAQESQFSLNRSLEVGVSTR